MKMGVNNQVQSGRIQIKVDKDESSQYGACSTICCTTMQGAWYFFCTAYQVQGHMCQQNKNSRP